MQVDAASLRRQARQASWPCVHPSRPARPRRNASNTLAADQALRRPPQRTGAPALVPSAPCVSGRLHCIVSRSSTSSSPSGRRITSSPPKMNSLLPSRQPCSRKGVGLGGRWGWGWGARWPSKDRWQATAFHAGQSSACRAGPRRTIRASKLPASSLQVTLARRASLPVLSTHSHAGLRPLEGRTRIAHGTHRVAAAGAGQVIPFLCSALNGAPGARLCIQQPHRHLRQRLLGLQRAASE